MQRVKKNAKHILAWCIIAPAAYLLLIGPLFCAVGHGWVPEGVAVIYAPLSFLPSNIFTEMLGGYVELWTGPSDCGGTGEGG